RWLTASICLLAWGSLSATTLPPGFQETVLIGNIFELTSFEWTPNGDLWIITKSGGVRVLRAGATQTTNIASISVHSAGECGLLGLAVDPAFATNQFLYFYYTVPSSPPHNRVSRFHVVGNSLQSETVLLDGPDLVSDFHQSGNVMFGLDGLIYISMGDNELGAVAQQKNTMLGKILRIAPDGSIPPGNPFVGDPNARPEVWAMGFRNAWRFSIQPVTGTLFIGDVGQAAWEELNLGVPGANYGWPVVEGPDPAGVAGMTYPVFSYSHNGGSAAITAGAHMVAGNFPSQYVGDYFYGDYALHEIYHMKLDANNQPISNEIFEDAAPPTHIRVGPDGALYYGSYNFEAIYRIAYVGGANRPPLAVGTVNPLSGLTPLGVSFDATGSSDPDNDPLTFKWSFGDGAQSNNAVAFHTYNNPGVYTALLEVNDTHVISTLQTRVVAGNRSPAATILSPAASSMFNAGDTVNFSATASDPEDGTLGAGAFSWMVVFHHDTHTHPYLGPITGTTAGSFTTANIGETSANIWYEVLLSVTDSGAPLGSAGELTTTRSVSIFPNLSTMTLTTTPRSDLALTLDGTPFTAPKSVQGVVGQQRIIEALSPQTPGDGHTYTFSGWSDGGSRLHTISTPAVNTTFTANFGCDLQSAPADLTMTNASGGQITLTWPPPVGGCLSTGPAVYHIYAASTRLPSTLPGNFPSDPPYSLIGTTTGP
ncbi:MAG TPA: PQQ-dependent sugar dehydrogenase, partial [Patescibacteria group bacterium]|nr:PQQ-dependent sugar dehydrogenase [Patescibacteria group bacterium]